MKTNLRYRSLSDLHTRCEPNGDCLVWTGETDHSGYGRIRRANRKWQAAHRRAWILAYGEIPEGMIIHHRCLNPLCLNVEHLECLTKAEHDALHGGQNDEECAKGHRDWTIRPDGKRYCAECHRTRNRAYYHATKTTLALAVCLATLGLAAGLFAFPARADNPAGAKTLDDLWAMGYVMGMRIGAGYPFDPLNCGFIYVLSANGVPFPDMQEPVIELNPNPSRPECRTPPDQIQANIDALVTNYPSAPQPAPTTTAAPDAPSAPAAPAAPAGTPTAPGGTTTVTVSDPTLQAQIDALNAKIDALANPTVDARLTALEQRQAVNDARIATLELKAGIIVPEAKNEPPFTNPV